MALIVQKFGGTSVENTKCIEQVITKISQERNKGNQVVVIVSAMSGETNRLIGLSKAFKEKPESSEYAKLLSTGEQASAALLAIALKARNQSACSYMPSQTKIIQTDSDYQDASILAVNCADLYKTIECGVIPVIAGFQGASLTNETTLLGRGGSDLTAVAIAAGLKADECQIYTDVNGVYSADPRIISQAICLQRISINEMLLLAKFGAKVLQYKSVEYAKLHNVQIRVLSTFNNGPGTLIYNENEKNNIAGRFDVTGVTCLQELKISIHDLPDDKKIIDNIKFLLNQEGVNPDVFFIQKNSKNLIIFSFTLNEEQYLKAISVIGEALSLIKESVTLVKSKIAKISIIGNELDSSKFIKNWILRSLEIQNITVEMRLFSKRRISIVVAQEQVEEAIRTLHYLVFLSQYKVQVSSLSAAFS